MGLDIVHSSYPLRVHGPEPDHRRYEGLPRCKSPILLIQVEQMALRCSDLSLIILTPAFRPRYSASNIPLLSEQSRLRARLATIPRTGEHMDRFGIRRCTHCLRGILTIPVQSRRTSPVAAACSKALSPTLGIPALLVYERCATGAKGVMRRMQTPHHMVSRFLQRHSGRGQMGEHAF